MASSDSGVRRNINISIYIHMCICIQNENWYYHYSCDTTLQDYEVAGEIGLRDHVIQPSQPGKTLSNTPKPKPKSKHCPADSNQQLLDNSWGNPSAFCTHPLLVAGFGLL